MTKEEFQACQEQYADKIEQMRKEAHDLHQSVKRTMCCPCSLLVFSMIVLRMPD